MWVSLLLRNGWWVMAGKHAHIYSDPRWARVKRQVHEEETHCRACGEYVDRRYPPRHKMSRSVDHLIDLDLGGDPFDRDNVGLMHYGCNSRKGARQQHRTDSARRGTAPAVVRGTRIHIPAGDL
jgi:5-methylcytosine-specific restriction endonuclease McrA